MKRYEKPLFDIAEFDQPDLITVSVISTEEWDNNRGNTSLDLDFGDMITTEWEQ